MFYKNFFLAKNFNKKRSKKWPFFVVSSIPPFALIFGSKMTIFWGLFWDPIFWGFLTPKKGPKWPKMAIFGQNPQKVGIWRWFLGQKRPKNRPKTAFFGVLTPKMGAGGDAETQKTRFSGWEKWGIFPENAFFGKKMAIFGFLGPFLTIF